MQFSDLNVKIYFNSDNNQEYMILISETRMTLLNVLNKI